VIINRDTNTCTLLFNDNEQDIKDTVVESIDSELAREVPNAFFMRQHRPHWDGKKHFLDKATLSFPSGLLEEALHAIGKLNIVVDYKINNIGTKPFVHSDSIKDTLYLAGDKGLNTFKLRPYQVDAVKNFYKHNTGVINYAVASGKTAVGAQIIKQALPKLQKGQRIAFFTNSSEIFNQSVENLQKFLNIRVGRLGRGHHTIEQVTVCTIQTVNSYLNLNPEAKLSLTSKQMISKKIAKKYYKQFKDTGSPRKALASFLLLFTPKTKADQVLQQTLQKVYTKNKTDKDVLDSLYTYVQNYEHIVQTKNKKDYDKRKFIDEFLNSIVLFVADECHHSKADTWYKVLLSCKNAVYRAGLSGSIDPKDEITKQALRAVYGSIVAKVTSKQMSDQGYTAKAVVQMIPINQPDDIATLPNKSWFDIYRQGIIENAYRNKLIVALATKTKNQGHTVLIIATQIDHCNILQDMFTANGVKATVIDGQQKQEKREKERQALLAGKTKIVIATTIFDEGVDIHSIDVLILASGGKAYRQVVQRVGRVLRKDKADSDKSYVFDFIDKQHQLLAKHSNIRVNIYKNQQFKVLGI
jgi:superfamily II DNA or RNA helicase